MAKKTLLVSDQSGTEIPEGKGATVRIQFSDARMGIFELDLTDEEGKTLTEKARKVNRRGRKPGSKNAEAVAA